MYALLGCESDQEDAPRTVVAQIARKASRRAQVISKNRRVGIDFGAEALPDDQLRPVDLQFRVKRRPGRALPAMIGPKGLLAIWHGDAVERVRARMRCGERAVAWRMPILCQRNVIKALGETIDY